MKRAHKIMAAFMAAGFGAGAACAADAPLPDYFVQTVVQSTAAESLAQHCATLALRPEAVSAASSDTLERLLQDGVDVETASETTMTATSEMIRESLARFIHKHDLEGADGAAACDAGLREIAEASVVGSYLRVIAP